MISVGESKALLCKGEFHPAELYKGDKKIAGFNEVSVETSDSISLNDCYNDKLHDAILEGNSIQDGTPTPETPVEVESVGELVTEGDYAGRYRVSVTARGKNLYDKKTYLMEDGYWISGYSGDYAASESYSCTIVFVPCDLLQGKTITLSPTAGQNVGIAFYDADKIFISGTGYKQQSSCTITVPNNATYMRFSVSKDNKELFQIELGSEATDYEPYIEPKTFDIYLDKPLRKIGDYADYIDFEKGAVVRNIAKKVFDGTERWEYDFSTNSNTFLVQEKVTSYVTGASNKLQALSNRLRGNTWDNIWRNYYKTPGATDLITGVTVTYNANDGSGQAWLHFRLSPYSTLPTLDEWKEQLAAWYDAGAPFTVWYVIPDTEEPIDLPEIPTRYGYTNIYELTNTIKPTLKGIYKQIIKE